MKSLFKTLIYILFLISNENIAYSLSDNEIKQICQKKPRKSTCRKNLKKLNLLKGNQIEIPVIPFKK